MRKQILNTNKHLVVNLLLALTMLFTGCEGANTATPDATATQAPTASVNQEPPSAEATSPAPSAAAATTERPFASGEGIAVIELPSILDDGEYTTAYDYTETELNTTAGTGPSAVIVFAGDTAQITGAGAAFSGGVLTIRQAGTYELSGTLSNGQVLINTSKNDLVRLVLNGVTLHNETGPAIFAPQAEKTTIVLTDGTQNAVSDGAAYAAMGEDAPDAAIYAQDDLQITGDGQLTVTGNYKHGIRTQDHLSVTNGVIIVSAAGDALRGRDGVTIQNGAFTLTAGGDGIQSNNANSTDVGFVIIDGGTFNITARNDGIQAESALTITGGTFNITTGGGSANAPTRTEDFRGGMGGGRPGQTVAATAADSESMKALKAGNQIFIMGGVFTIDAEDDGVHSNGDVFITGGTLTIRTGDDGVHADAAAVISGGTIAIPVCYEGIEGLSVTVTGGGITVTAGDDAINAAGGVDSASQWGGPMGGDRFAANGDIFIRISGGSLDLYAPYDGIDSNGNVFLEGGTVTISGPSQGMDGAIDLDGTLLITGGALITAGSVLNVSAESTQPVLLVSYSQQQAAGSEITITDADGNIILAYTSAIGYTMSGFTSPFFTIGEEYTLSINGTERTSVTLTSAVTSIADDGGAYNGGMGGGRGDWGGGAPSGGGNRPSGR